jgi:ketosteroid isomerase-like protein
MDRRQVEQIFAAFEAKDIEAVMAQFADDATVTDPHYPIPEMAGKAAIRRGFEWALGNMERAGFNVVGIWSDGDSGAVEVDTHHVFKGGMEVKFTQIFVIELQDGLITRLHSFGPHRPGGVGGAMLKVTGFFWRRKGRGEFERER